MTVFDPNKTLILITDETLEKKSMFCVRYAFQAVLYAFWRERNKIKLGDKMLPLSALKRMIDKVIRNKISLMRAMGVKGMEELMQFWFCNISKAFIVMVVIEFESCTS